ncbi:MAG: hypothetical protein GY772_31940 [bacterium]|nr:hypothetical protein [bacterium]
MRETVVVHAGHMTKPQAAEAVRRGDCLFIGITITADWLCRALLGQSRGRHPLRDLSPTLTSIKNAALRLFHAANGRGAKASEAKEEAMRDPMEALAPGSSALADDLETPRKGRKRMRRDGDRCEMSGTEIVTLVQVSDVVEESRRLPAGVGGHLVGKSLRVLVVVTTHKKLYVSAEDLDSLLELLSCLVVRDGATEGDAAAAPAASCMEWFDPILSCWNVREEPGKEVRRSRPVPRVHANGTPLSLDEYAAAKTARLCEMRGAA